MSDRPVSRLSREDDSAANACADRTGSGRWHCFVAPLVITMVGLILYLPGLTWGLPGTASWSQDTIAGLRTLGVVEGWPAQWKGRYPPLHYLILAAAYEPVQWHWQRTGQRVIDDDTGEVRLLPPHAPKIGLLILIARSITVVMAIAAGLGLWAATRRLTQDDTAALLAAMTLMLGAAFTYFAHLGNVDIPSMCWFAWSLYFYARALHSRKWHDCALLGLFGSLAFSTKDAIVGMYPGMAVVLLVNETNRFRKDAPLLRALFSALWQSKWLIGLAMFILPYLIFNGVFANLDPYLTRMKYWLGITPGTLHTRQYRYPDQLRLLLATFWYAAGAVGWPMLLAMVASVLYALRRYGRTALIVLIPVVGYYVVVVAQIGFVYSRFLFAPIAMTCILVGLAGAALVRRREWPMAVRFGIPCMILLPSLGYTVAINAEMLTDSRYAVETWFREHVTPPSQVGAFSKPQYLPRLSNLGYDTRGAVMAHESFDQSQPEYLILTSYNYVDFDADQRACMKDLLAGRLGYSPVVTFKGRYLSTGSSWLSLAGWGAPTPGKISPTITILRRTVP
ncbi:MAG: glycosyltransferase family 39 protein [Phycisphaerae bacterium]